MQRNSSNAKQYVLAVKSSARQSVQSGWHKELEAVPGVRLLGVSGNHAQVEATPEAVQALRSKLGNDFYIEENEERFPA
jgi:hypothetical protein